MGSNKTSNIHHILPTSRGGSSHRLNTRKEKSKLHAAYHYIFVNDTIAEAVIRLLDFQGTAITQEAYITIAQSVSEEDREFYYRKECFKKSL